MSSVSSVNSNALSSIYGSRPVISGLASGMDTEGMIENAVSGLQAKITSLQRQKTSSQWKQEAYRSLSDQLVQFSRKYTSFSSATNLLSASFFDKAVLTTAKGDNAKFVSASGKSTSNVDILGIKQLATTARYATKKTNVLDSVSGNISAGSDVNLSDIKELSTMSGSMTINYGVNAVSIQFNDTDIFKDDATGTAAEKLAEAINKKLAEQNLTIGETTRPASDNIEARVNYDGGISFVDKKNAGNNIYIKDASKNIQKALGFELSDDPKEDNISSFTVDASKLTDLTKTNAEWLSGKKMNINFNGTTKSVAMPGVTKNDDGTFRMNGTDYDLSNNIGQANFTRDYVTAMQTSLDNAFGAGKLTVSNQQLGAGANTLQLKFEINDKDPVTHKPDPGNYLSINSDVNTTLGMMQSETSYLNTGKTLEDLLGSAAFAPGSYNKVAAVGDLYDAKDANGNVVYKVDSEGYRVEKDSSNPGDDTYYRVDANTPKNADGSFNFLFKMEINGTEVGQFSKSTAMESVMLAINNNSAAGVTVNYSKMSNEFVFTAKDTGSGGRVDIQETLADGGKNIAAELFGKVTPPAADYTNVDSSYKLGTDAKLKVEVNGTEMELTRSSNTFDLDGMSVTVNGTFNESYATLTENEKVKFSTVSDADKIVDAVKSMVEDYNKMISDIKEAYSTMPLYKNKNTSTRYEPLTDEEMADLSESAIKNYEEKAKQGLLFADQDLSALYDKLKNAMAPAGNDGSFLRSIGLTTDYTDGLTTIQLDESKLRDALSSNPDGVRDAFTKTKGTGGATTDGIMQTLKNSLDTYARVEGENKGILIKKAGSKYAAASLLSNGLQKEIDNFDEQIGKWQDKLSDKVDYYTRKFTQLEKLIAQMNSQSSALMGMMGQ